MSSTFLEYENVLKLDGGDGCINFVNILKTIKLYTLKWVNVMVYKLSLNKANF